MADKNYYIILPNGKSKMYSEKDFNTPNVQNFINDKNNGASVLEQVPYDINDKNTRDTDVYTLTLENGKSKDYSSAEFNSPNVQKWLGGNPKVSVSRFRRYNPYLDEAEQVGSETDNAQYIVKPTDPNSNEPVITLTAEEYKANRDKYASTNDRMVVRVNPDGTTSNEEFMSQVDYDRKVKQLDDFVAVNKELLDKYDTAMAGAVGDTSPAADMTAYIRKNPDSDIARAVAERERLTTERNANPYYQKLRKDSIAEAKGIIDTINGVDDKTRADKAARKFAKDAEKILEAPEKGENSGFKDFLLGHKDTFNDADFWTAGISAIVANSRAKNEIDGIREKLQGKPINIEDITPDNVSELKKYLNDDEIRLLQSLAVYAKAQADRAYDTSNMYQAGMTAAQSLEFMVEFIATSGISSAIKKGVGDVAGKVISSASKNIANNAARNLAIGATKAAEAVVTPALQAAATTYLHPSSWRNVSDAASYQFDQQTGDLAKKDFWTAFKETSADNFIETWSEMALEPVFGVLGEGLGKFGKTGLAKSIKTSPLGQFAALIGDNAVANTLRKAGFHGYVEEMLEEVLGAGTRQLLGVDDQAWEQFWDKENLGQMAVAFLPMSLIGAVGGGLAHKVKAKETYEQEAPFIREMLRTRGYSDAEIDEKLSRKANTMDDIANNINDVVSSLNDIQTLTEDEKEHLIRFAAGTASTNLFDAIQEQQRTDAKNEINDELKRKMGPYWVATPVPDDGEEHREVREIKYADGRRVFVTSPEASNGKLAAIDEDGKHIFIDEADIASGVNDGSIVSDTRKPINDFLNNEREGRRKGAESARMDTEYKERLEQVHSQAVPGATVNLGTAESPVTGTIIGWNGEKFVVQSAERGAEEYDVNQMADILGVGLHVNTDAENEAQKEMDAKSMLDLSKQINEQAKGMVFTDTEGQKHNLDVLFDTWQEEDGTWMAAIMSGDEEYDIPMTDLSQQYSSYLANKNNPEIETEESAPAESESAIAEPEDDNTPRDFRGNPLPLKDDGSVNQTALWNNDPEAWAKWNDANPNKRIDTKAYVQGRIDSLTGDIKKLEKAIEKETKTTGDFDAIDRFADQIDEKRTRQAQLQQILDGYAAAEVAAAEREKAHQLELNEPQNITQLAVRILQEVKAHSLNRDSFKKELGWGNTELAQFFPWWAKKGKGITLDALAEHMVERDSQYGFVPMVDDAEQKDTKVAKDALIEVMQTISRPGDVRDIVMNENKAFEDAQKDAEDAAIEADVMARYGMTMDEYNALSEEEKAKLEDNVGSSESKHKDGDVADTINIAIANAENQLSNDEAETFVNSMEKQAIVAPEIEFSKESYSQLFPDNRVQTPIGEIKLGENQFEKLQSKNRTGQLGMMYGTLTSPDVIMYEVTDADKIPANAERKGSLLFVKTFTDSEGNKYTNFESVSVRKEGLEIVISNHILGKNGLLAKLQDNRIVYMRKPSGVNSERHLVNDSTSLPDLVPTQPDGLSESKDTEISENTNIPAENSAEDVELNGQLYNISDLERQFKDDVELLLSDNGVDVDVVGVKLIGSRIAGSPREDSDLDLLVEYKGDYTEDALFNMLNSEEWEFNGIKLDINPITEGKSGTIEQFLKRNAGFVKNENTVEEARQEVDTNPSEAQKEAGNYKMGHVKIDGYEFTMENPKGSVRKGVDGNGTPWEITMNNDYGYIRGTIGVDGDHIDMFLSDNPEQGDVYVVDQVNPDGSFDEHKVMYGFNSVDEAKAAYLSNYSEGWQGLGAITPVSKDEFKKWIESSKRKTKPFAEYASVKPLEEDTPTDVKDAKPAFPTPNSLADAIGSEDPVRIAQEVARMQEFIMSSNDLRMVDTTIADAKKKAREKEKDSPMAKAYDIILSALKRRKAQLEKLDKAANEISVMAEKVGVPVRVLRGVAEVENKEARDAILSDTRAGRAVPRGWFNPGTGEVEIFLPGVVSFAEKGRSESVTKSAQETYLHEVVAHYGLRQLLGDNFDSFMDSVWEMMSEEDKHKWERAVGYIKDETKRRRAAADEYVARIAEKLDANAEISEEEKNIWQKIVEAVKEFLGIESRLNDEEISRMLYQSMANLQRISTETQETGEEAPVKTTSDRKPRAKSSSKKIDDFGEEIAGARKNVLKTLAKSFDDATEESLVALPLGKVFKRPDLKKLVDEGTISPDDARWAEAMMQTMIFKDKPRADSHDKYLARIAERKGLAAPVPQKIGRWAKDVKVGIDQLKEFLLASPEDRAEIIEDMRKTPEDILLQDRIDRARYRERNGVDTGDLHTPNQVWAISQVLEALGYQPGDKVKLPLSRIEASYNGKYFELKDDKGHKYNYVDNALTLDEAINGLVQLAKAERGDNDVQFPMKSFRVRGEEPLMEDSGKFTVTWIARNGGVSVADVDNEEEADKKIANLKAKGISANKYPLQQRNGYKHYRVLFIHPLTGEELRLGLYDNISEAQLSVSENYDENNASVNEQLSKKREAEGKETRKSHVPWGVRMDDNGKYTLFVPAKMNPTGQDIVLAEGFDSYPDAGKHFYEHEDEFRNLLDEYKSQIRRAPYFSLDVTPRKGQDYRDGKDVTPEQFSDTFGFRGVQFGNWTNDADRQAALNEAYDSFMDLADILGLSPRAMSLGGELGLAFGARGTGGALAHYELNEVVINLTKTRGAGSLAHEWWHALDNYFSRRGNVPLGMVTYNMVKDIRTDVADAYRSLVDNVRKSDYARRSAAIGEYWGRIEEITARLFAEWVDRELAKQGRLNHFLSRGIDIDNLDKVKMRNYALFVERSGGSMPYDEFEKTGKALSGFPYPIAEEVESFSDAVRNIFNVIQEESGGNGVLFSREVEADEDEKYMKAVEYGDTDTMQRMVYAAANRAGYDVRSEHRDGHGAPGPDVDREDFTNLDALRQSVEEDGFDTNLYGIAFGVSSQPDDYFSDNGPRWFGYNNESGLESFRALRKAIDETRKAKDGIIPTIKVFRCVPDKVKPDNKASDALVETKLRAGDWVSPSRSYAVAHGDHRFGEGNWHIIEQDVPVTELWWDGNDIREWGWDDGGTYAYKNVPNNIKSLEPVTFDDSGKVIPLSQRFDEDNPSILFSRDEGDKALSESPRFRVNTNVETLVERTYRKNGAFSFTGKDRIRNSADVAYIFRQLENAAVENSFIVFVKDGKPTILHTGIGDITSTSIDLTSVLAGYNDFGADEIFMVHNHPSGVLKASFTDIKMLETIQHMVPAIPVTGIIIDTVSGEFGRFDSDSAIKMSMPESQDEYPVEVMSFDKIVFSPEYKSELSTRQITGPKDVAAFLSAHRLGEGDKLGALLLNNNLVINANLVTNNNSLTRGNALEMAAAISDAAVRCGATRVILFGNFNFDGNTLLFFREELKRKSGDKVELTDGIQIEGDATYSINDGTLNGMRDGLRFSRDNEKQRIFISNAEQAVEGLNMGKAAPAAWLKAIQGRGGLKASEDKWLGLSDWLNASDKKSITKDELLDFIRENMIRINEYRYAEDMIIPEILNRYQQRFQELTYEAAETLDDNSMPADWDEYAYKKMIEEEGDYFGEAFNFNSSTHELDVNYDLDGTLSEAAQYYLTSGESRPINSTRLDYTTEGLENKREIALTVPTIESWNEDDQIHFGDAGQGRAVAWIRFGETILPSRNVDYNKQVNDELRAKYSKEDLEAGNFSEEDWAKFSEANARKAADARTGKRVLVIDEIQSKRHQEGREKGYKDMDAHIRALDAFQSFNREMHEKYGQNTIPADWGEADRNRFNELRDAEDATAKNIGKGIPDAPFEKNWHELAMKRMLRLAAEEGYDYVAWTTGAQQAERYSIGGVVDDIYFAGVFDRTFDNDEKLRYIDINLNNGHIFHLGVDENGNIVEEYNGDGAVLRDEYKSFQGKTLADVVGKELAVRVLDMEEGSSLNGEGLRVGGEGMKGFYDDILPRFMDKYGKKWGVKTQDIELPNVEESARIMHAVPVTDEMKESVMEGQLMFSRDEFTPENRSKEVKQEVDRIVAKSLLDGTFRKAPNGKDSNLSLDQWALVRTKAFKKWFGDWELAAKKVQIVPASINHGISSLKDATQWAKDNLLRTYSNNETGGKGEITVNTQTINKFVSNDAVAKSESRDVHYAVLKQIPALLRESIDVEQHPDYRKVDGVRKVENGINAGITMHRLFGAVSVDGKTYRVKITLKENTDLSRTKAYSYEATKIELLAGQSDEAVATSRNSNNSITLANLLNGIDKSYSKGEKLIDYSRIVDENGEPKVLYHGTPNDFTEFDRSHIGETSGDRGLFGAGFYFNDKEGYVKMFATARGSNGYIIPAFLNIRNPYIVEDHDIDELSVLLGGISDEELQLNRDYRPYLQVKLLTAKREDLFSDNLQKAGYDGVMTREYQPAQIVAFSPNQIKSATDNDGEFNTNNPDIRFSRDAAGREPQRVEGDARKQGEFENNNDYNNYLLDRAKGKMNIAVPVEIMEYPDVPSVKRFFSMLDMSEEDWTKFANSLKSYMYSGHHMGYFGGEVKKILIFGSIRNSEESFDKNLIHECIHQIDDASGHQFSEKIAKILIENANEAYPAIQYRYKTIQGQYKEKDWNKEMLAYILSDVVYSGDRIDFLEGNKDFEKVLNAINYESGYSSKRNVLHHSDGGRNAEDNRIGHDSGRESGSLGRTGEELSSSETSRERRRSEAYEVSASLPAREAAAGATAEKLGVKVNVVARENMPRGHEFSLGTWIDGEIYICPENCADEDDVKMTVIHEAVGHNGLRKLVGNENMDNFCMELYKKSTGEVRRAIIDFSRSHGYNFIEGTEEYLAHLSETMDFTEPELTFWDKVKEAVRNLFAKVGINLPVDGRDLRWILWQSYNANKRGELANDVARAALAHKFGFTLKADRERDKARRIVRDRVVDEHYDMSAAAMYNRAATNWRARLKETWVDQYAAVDELVKAIEKASGKTVKSFEDVRKALNQQSSKGLKAMERWESEFFAPLKEAVKSCMNAANCSLEDVERYIMVKHGLERNDKFAKRDAREFYQAIFDSFKKRLAENDQLDDEAKEKLLKKQTEKLNKHLDNIENGTDSKYMEFREKDYGGLTSLYSDYEDYMPYNPEVETEEEFNERVNNARKPRYETLAQTELAAEQEVKEWEDKFGGRYIELWARINAATKDTLKHQYESNMLSKTQYEYVRDMFDYYVPLRGFKETTAEDMYSYYMSDQSHSFEPPLLKAKGRSTEAESPFGHIGAAASSAIAADMKNQTKLALYYMVSNRAKNDLVTISDVWYENTGVDELGRRVFSPVYPEFSDDLSSAEAKKAYEEWEAGMKEKALSGFAFKGRKELNLHDTVINIDSKQERSHVIRFKLGGEDKMMFINGNPRAAQAINGELNVETSADYQKVFGKVLRWFSGINTSYNPEFWLSNMQRDTLMALMAVNIKEDAEYNAAFKKNFIKSMKSVVKMNKAFQAGKLGDSQIENWYREFAEGGGITGYTTLKKNEEWELELRKFTGSERKSIAAVRDAFDKVQQFGEAIEQMTRFTAYMTSREQGKSIVDSVADAKELTVNFNRKGSGKSISWKEADKLRGKDGRKLSEVEKALLVGASWIPAYGRRFIMFFNASVQGLNTMYNLMKSNKKRFNTWTAAYLALGMMNAAMHALLDDDDDYLDIPDYERRNNLLVGAGGTYLKWAMPQETRIFYGLGDMIVNHALGRTPDKNIVTELLASVSDIAPLNPAGGLSAVAPSALTPIVELAMNRDYKGSKIYNDLQYLSDDEKKRTPKYLKAYKGTGRVYVNISQALNWLTGGDYTDAGFININPAAVEHLVEGATGGAGTTIEKFIQGIGGVLRGSVKALAGDNFEDSAAEKVMDWLGTDEFMARNTPFLRRILTINDERYRNAHTTDLFNYYRAEAEHTKKRMNQYINAGNDDKFGKLMDSGDIDVMNIYNSYKGILETYNTMIREAGNNRERKELAKEQDAYRKEMIKEISNIK